MHGQLLRKKIACLSNPEVIASVIEKNEGCFFANNPGCLVYVGQVGAKRGRAGYASFRSVGEGHMACVRDVERKLGTMDYVGVVIAWGASDLEVQRREIARIVEVCGK